MTKFYSIIANSYSFFLQRGGGGDIISQLKGFQGWILEILNVIVILVALYGIFNAASAYFQGDQSAVKKLLLIVAGLIIWFLAPTILEAFEGGSLPGAGGGR